MIAKWIRETLQEIEQAKKNQNLYRLSEMYILLRKLRDIQSNLPKSRN